MESVEIRRRTMQAVKSKNTAPEMVVRRLLHSLGFRYRLHRSEIPGCPDIVFLRERKVIFVHGCFWHGHTCQRGHRIPKTNTQYWTRKIAANEARDRKATRRLRRDGWKVLTLWECKIGNPDALVNKLKSFLQ